MDSADLINSFGSQLPSENPEDGFEVLPTNADKPFENGAAMGTNGAVLGTFSNYEDPTKATILELPNDRIGPQQRKRKSAERVNPDLTEKTSETQDDDDVDESENDLSNVSSQKSLKNCSSKNGAILIGLLVVVIVVGIMMESPQIKVDNTEASFENYIKSVRSTLNNNFPAVTKETRNLVRVIGEKVFLEPDDHAPLVIVVGGKNSYEFSEAIDQAIQKAANEEGERSKTRSIPIESDTNRAELHENLLAALGISAEISPRSAILMDVDLLKWDTVLVLHAFADHENYPVPKAVLFLTVSSNNEAVSAEESCDKRMAGFLKTRWIENGGTLYNIPPIIARISYFICV